MTLRKLLLFAVLLSAVSITVVLSTWRSRDKVETSGNNNIREPNTTSTKMEVQPEDVEPNPATTPETSDLKRDSETDGLSQTVRTAVKSIEDYSDSVDKFLVEKDPDMFFADLSGHAGTSKEKWSRFASEKSVQKAGDKIDGWYKIAHVWERDGRIVKVVMLFSSSSGDWAKDIYQYFREDGSLAYVLSHFGTFVDEYKFEESRYFDPYGRLIHKFEVSTNLMNDEPVEKVKNREHDTLRDGNDYYKTIGRLPFAHLSPKKWR